MTVMAHDDDACIYYIINYRSSCFLQISCIFIVFFSFIIGYIGNYLKMAFSEDPVYVSLDQKFDKILADMKPYVLKLPHKTGTCT